MVNTLQLNGFLKVWHLSLPAGTSARRYGWAESIQKPWHWMQELDVAQILSLHKKGDPAMPRTLSGILRATERWVAGKTPSITTLRCPQCHDHGSGRRSNGEMTWPHMPRASRGHSYTEHATTCTHSHQGESAFCSLRDTSQEKLVFPKMRGFRKNRNVKLKHG